MNIGKDDRSPERKRKGFSMVPNTLFLNPDLEPQDTVTWCHLHFIARGRGFIDSTDLALATAMGVSERTVRRSLERLERQGFIHREMVDSRRTIALIPDARDDEQSYTLKVV